MADGPLPGAADTAELRLRGNELFEAERFADAATCYRSALARLSAGDHEPSPSQRSHGSALRLNLAMCLSRMGEDLGEAVALCDEVLAVDPDHTKALYRRAAVRHDMAQLLASSSERDAARETLQAAKRDLVQVAKAQPGNRPVRTLLDEVNDCLRQVQQDADGDGSRLKSALGGLYGDRKPAPPPPPPVTCSTCDRQGHSECGKAWWIAQRAQWLGVTKEEAGLEPPGGFGDDGPLLEARARRMAGANRRPSLDDLSVASREALEDCLDCTERPYPPLRERYALATAVACAEELWADSGT
mmetsp:Transcript_42918/g.118691  ORF Transcript_42918/g.118691 Transcript_42918/m.118691 type:complete len:301 (+) Transcript_42918:83-985(+)